MSTEAELRRIWGARYAENMERVGRNYEGLSDQAKAVFDNGGVNEVMAVALLDDVAYRTKSHPQHQEASQRVSAFFQQAAGDDDLIL